MFNTTHLLYIHLTANDSIAMVIRSQISIQTIKPEDCMNVEDACMTEEDACMTLLDACMTLLDACMHNSDHT